MTLDLNNPISFLVPARKAKPEPHDRLATCLTGIMIFCHEQIAYTESDVEIIAMVVHIAADTVYGLVLRDEFTPGDRSIAKSIAECAWNVCRGTETRHNGALLDAINKLEGRVK